MKFYDISNMLKTNAQYMMLLGQRANGKSYQVKETVLKEAYLGTPFVYLRRWQADIKQLFVESYFSDMPIKRITHGEWDSVKAWNGGIYFAKRNDKGDLIKSDIIGRYCALNEYERYKSNVFNAKNIIYEEFITDKTYLLEEPRLLQHFVSTVARLDEVRVFLVGNTLSRVCPYFSEWCLDGVLSQKQGTIEVYHHHLTSEDGTESVIDIAVEYCATMNIKNKMFFGQSAKQIVSGEWDTIDMPHLPKPREWYEKVYEVLVEYQKFRFVIELLVDPYEGGKICFVYPHTKDRKVMRKITNQFSDNPMISAKLDVKRRPEAFINECFRLGKVCYSDNLTGSDFKHVNDNFRIGSLVC